jgi:hypothetical protein
MMSPAAAAIIIRYAVYAGNDDPPQKRAEKLKLIVEGIFKDVDLWGFRLPK